MKIKRLLYILLVLALFPISSAAAEEYPYLPTFLKEEVVSQFKINTAGKTMLYERVNIFGDLDAWMIGWFDAESKIVTGITDNEDIIYYSKSYFNETAPADFTDMVSAQEGLEIARNFMYEIMPRTAFKLVSAKAYEYTFSQTHNGIRLLGRDATVVVDKRSGQVIYYKGFGQSGSSFELMERLITPEYAFELFYENIGTELVYNTVFDHNAKIKTLRPMYILNRSRLKAVDAQTGEIKKVVMHDYNYYYNDSYYNDNYYLDNNINTEEKNFVRDGSISASGYDINSLTGNILLGLYEDYSATITPGRLSFYSDIEGNENTLPVLKIDFVPTKYAVNTLEFSELFDEGNIQSFSNVESDTAFVFARAYVNAENGNLVDFETVQNADYVPNNNKYYNLYQINRFVLDVTQGQDLKYFGSLELNENEKMITYARYADGIRVIGEGVSLIYNSALNMITDYSLVLTKGEFISTEFMMSPGQLKPYVKQQLSLELFYADKDEKTKFVIYDATNKNIAFDPFTGMRIDRTESGATFLGSCSLGNEEYIINGAAVTAPPPVINSGRLFLPLGVVASRLGYEMSAGEEISLTNAKDIIKIIGDRCTINGEDFVIDLPPANISDNIYVSARSLRTLFGMYISWDIETDKIRLVR
ncbi:MAG: copper amine oxidase N-terminal domain-containing protein [Monoglobales bacterium]